MQKIQTKLLILSLTAVLGVAVFAGMVIQAAWQDYVGMTDFQSTSLISQTAYELARNLTDERESAYNAATFLGEGTPPEQLEKYRTRIAASQASLGHLRELAAGNKGRYSERFRTGFRQSLEAETILNDMRQQLLAPGRPQVQDIDARLKSKALTAYDQALSPQTSFLPVLSVETEDAELVRKIFTQDNVARLQKDVWKIRGLVRTALRSGRLTESAQTEIKVKLLGIDEQVARLKNLADPVMAVEVQKLTDGSDYTAVMGKAVRLRDLDPKATDFSELGDLASYQTGPSARLEQSFTGFSRKTMLGIQAYTADRLAKARAHLLFLVGCSLGSVIGLSLLVIHFSRSIAHPLKELSEQLAGTAEQARQSVDVIAGSAVRLSEDASEQAAALEEISSSMEELSGMTSSSLDQMPRLADLAERAIKATDQGAQHVTHLNDAMQGIRKSTGAVASILKTIDEIAFQTNILALNAAVEAARAGEAGAGFSVVAEEVRALAQRSAQAARETAGKIEAAVKNTEQGAELGRLAQTQFAEISRLSGQYHGIISEVEAATKQCTEGVAQVNEAVARVDQITQRTAGSAEENATTSVDMQARMAAIFAQVRRLELMVHSRVREEEATVDTPLKPAGKRPRPRITPAPALQRAR